MMTDGKQQVLLGVFTVALISFFGWLAISVSDMNGRIIGIERDIKSLVATREEQKAAGVAGTARRLDDLERAE